MAAQGWHEPDPRDITSMAKAHFFVAGRAICKSTLKLPKGWKTYTRAMRCVLCVQRQPKAVRSAHA